MLLQMSEIHHICVQNQCVWECLHEYSIAGVICASVGYSAFPPASSNVSESELFCAFKDGTHLVYRVHGVFAVWVHTDWIWNRAQLIFTTNCVGCWGEQYVTMYSLKILKKKLKPSTLRQGIMVKVNIQAKKLEIHFSVMFIMCHHTDQWEAIFYWYTWLTDNSSSI